MDDLHLFEVGYGTDEMTYFCIARNEQEAMNKWLVMWKSKHLGEVGDVDTDHLWAQDRSNQWL